MPASLAQRLNHDARMGAAGEAGAAGAVGVQLSSSAGERAPGCAVMATNSQRALRARAPLHSANRNTLPKVSVDEVHAHINAA
jgi:hypothetical protein